VPSYAGLAVVFAGSLAAGAISTLLARGWARKLGIVSRPNPIVPQHTRPVAYMGGVGAGIGLAAVMLILGSPLPARILLPGVLMLGLGTLDDLHPLSPSGKFLAQAAVSATAVIMGVLAPFTGAAVPDGVLSTLVILVLVNAFNLTDVCDGLLPVLMLVACLGLATQGSDPWLAAAIAGATAGFLVWNRPDASIFLGDGGSHLLGFLAAVLVIDPAYGALGTAVSPWRLLAATLCLGLPLFELVFLVVIRIRKGIPWYRGSPDHYSLRLQNGRISKWGVLGVSAAISLTLCVMGQLIIRTLPAVRLAVLALAAAGFAVFGRLLLRMEPEHEE
jgi:UDP-GlcNAc:undecaprenyl-phosphate GlcNAc-1-phosphate transferase